MVSRLNARLLKAGSPPVGFINPTLYASSGVFANDIRSGNNKCTDEDLCCAEGFSAAPGWDPVTGWGSVDFAKLAALLGAA